MVSVQVRETAKKNLWNGMPEKGEAQEAMNLEEKNARRQKKKELKHQVRQAKKAMLCAGCEKGSTRKLLGEYEETLLQAEEMFVRYQTAARNLRQSKEAAVRLLDSVGERPADQLRQELDALITGMDAAREAT